MAPHSTALRVLSLFSFYYLRDTLVYGGGYSVHQGVAWMEIQISVPS